jgi:hypothetical protein
VDFLVHRNGIASSIEVLRKTGNIEVVESV